MMRYTIISITVLFFSFYSNAQTTDEAYRLSDRQLGGTARSIGLGSAFGAVGADFSSASINPAGMALYRSSEFMLSPAYEFSKNESSYIDNNTQDGSNKFHLESFGVLFSREIDNSKWKFRNIGFGYFTQNKFYDQYSISAKNTENSFMDYYANQAFGISPSSWQEFDPLGIGLFYEGYILNVESNNVYSTVAGPGLLQTDVISTDRSLREFNISASGNYNDKFYIGAALSFPDYQYDIVNTLSEEDVDDIYNSFENYSYTFEESTQASGVNLKLGLIYRITNPIRIGLSFQSPTSYSVDTYFTSSLDSRFEGVLQGNSDTYSSPEVYSNYNMRTPYIVTASAAYILKKGFLSLDYEYTDHTLTSYSTSSSDNGPDQEILSDLNFEIADIYIAASTIRIGAEYAPDQLRYRAGLILKTNPFYYDTPSLSSTLSAGIGYRFQSAAIDLAYRYAADETEYTMYSGAPTADVSLVNLTLAASVSFRF